MKRFLVGLLFLILMGVAQGAFAARIPDAELDVLKQTFPNLTVRFDGLVELPDGTQYIPVYPYKTEFISEQVLVSLTYPKNKSVLDKPDFFMFNTNFAFFKIKQDKNSKTIIYNEEIPTVVRMGLLPQDLLVPVGFKLPQELRIIAGNLIVPLDTTKQQYKEVVVATGKEVKDSPRLQFVEQTQKQLANKYFYATSFNRNSLTILNADTGKPFKEINFSSIPSDIKLTDEGKYLLLTTIKNNNVFVVDTAKTEVLKELPTGKMPSHIVVSSPERLAYVANRDDSFISVVDLNTMQMLEPISVLGNPAYLELSADGTQLYYLDAITGMVYSIHKQDDYFAPFSSKPLFKANNISKIQLANNKIYTLDRATSEIEVFYLKGKTQTDGFVNVANNSVAETSEQIATDNVDNAEIIENNEQEKVKEKLTFKQKMNKIMRKVLYYTEDNEVVEEYKNPDNLVLVMDKKEISAPEQEDESKELTKKEKLAKYFKEFMNYKETPKPVDKLAQIKTKTDAWMDFIQVPNRANDFAVINNKLYVICSDDYLVHIYDANTFEQIGSFELDKIGYYNAIKASNDKQIGVITNISSKQLTVFDTQKDVILQKLPLDANVHNVVITNKK